MLADINGSLTHPLWVNGKNLHVVLLVVAYQSHELEALDLFEVSSITCQFAVAKVKESLCLIRLLKHVNRISLTVMTILAFNAH